MNSKADPKYAWTPQDNQIAKVELELSKLLTRRLNERPELSLVALYQSAKIQGEVAPMLERLETGLHKRLQATTESVRLPDGKRQVFVTIHDF